MRRVAAFLVGVPLLFFAAKLFERWWGLDARSGIVIAGGLWALAIFVAPLLRAGEELRQTGRAQARLRAAIRGERGFSGASEPALGDETALGPRALAILLLAEALEDARDGRLADASELAGRVDPRLLAPAEQRLLDGILALVSASLGDPRRAARNAERALPTGSEVLDAPLGRQLARAAWGEPALAVLDATWARRGIPVGGRSALPRLRQLIRLRRDPAAISRLSAEEALALEEEARAVGDAELADELARARRGQGAYR